MKEIEARRRGFDNRFVVNVVATVPTIDRIDSMPDVVELLEVRSGLSQKADAQLSKAQAEALFCLVMPLADRNMSVWVIYIFSFLFI